MLLVRKKMATRCFSRHEQPNPSLNVSWRHPQGSLEHIPLDIMHLIVDHILAEDLLALSIVSKSLRNLLSDRSIWKNIYSRSTLLLPPGPYDWQSTSYFVQTLARAHKSLTVWPSLFDRPEIIHVRHWNCGRDASFSVLLGRWVLVAEGSVLVCYDSYSSHMEESGRTLFDAGADRRILRTFSAGCAREDGILAFAVLVFEKTFTIAKILMDHETPCGTQSIFISTPIVFENWTGLVNVRLYHRLLIVNAGDESSDWESSGRLVILDIDTLRRYRVPASTDSGDKAFGRMEWATTHFFAIKTHIVKVTLSAHYGVMRTSMECFPIPSTPSTHENDVLSRSHRSDVTCSIEALRDFNVIHESPTDSDTGKISFTLCGSELIGRTLKSHAITMIEVCLDPDGSISFSRFRLTEGMMAPSFCVESASQQRICGMAITSDWKPFLFALDYRWPSSVSLQWAIVDHSFPSREVVALDVFGGTAFFAHRLPDRRIVVEMVDFIRDVEKVEEPRSESKSRYRYQDSHRE